MPNQEAIRKQAIQRRLAGESVAGICEDLDRSRKWFYKWYKRYESGDPEWYKNKSKAPKNKPQSIDPELENAIISVRKQLMEKKFAQIGPQTIDWELRRMGMTPPSQATIKRVIERHGLKKLTQEYQRKGTPYPNLPVWFPNTLHQVDFWGPRYITGDGRFYSLNVMDVYTRRVSTYPDRHRNSETALKGLIRAWETLGEPEFIQFDNALAFRGSNRHPRSFSSVIKWCLYNKIQPIFIPHSEPWRNGHLERFHDKLEKQFFRQITFSSYSHLCSEMEKFTEYHNWHHHYSPLGGRTPIEVYERDKLWNFNSSYSIPNNFQLDDGFIHVVRLIRSDLKLNVFSETFPVPEELEYEYVVATICTKDHFIRVYNCDRELQFTIPYRLSARKV